MVYCRRADGRDPPDALRTLRPNASPASRAHVVRLVADERANTLRAEGLSPFHQADDLAGGRLLVYHVDEELSDGASEYETRGFFDVKDAPPWDTWVALVRDGRRWDVMVSWVPQPFLDLAEAGMSVNAVDCIGWLPDAKLPFADEIRALGLA